VWPSFERGTNAASYATFGSAWKTATSPGTQGTGVTGKVAANWRGQIAAFL
jgi:hypothetical protein